MKFKKVGITVKGHALYVGEEANADEIKNSIEKLIKKSDNGMDALKGMMGMK
jgi:hypothetical protein